VLLEKIIQKRTLADAFIANDRMKSTLKGFVYFYSVHAVVLGAGLIYLALVGLQSTLGAVLSLLGATLLLPLLIASLSLLALYIILALAAWGSSRTLSPIGSALTAAVSLLIHLLFLLGLGLLALDWAQSLISTSQITGQGINLRTLIGADGLPDNAVKIFMLFFIVRSIDLLIWIVLLATATSRSIKALVSSFRTVPGAHLYGYATTVRSSSQRGSELGFLESALSSPLGRFYFDATELEDLYDPDSYLVRFLHRNGQVLAASLQSRSDRRLMAIFPGKESPRLNTAVLLEDSYIIQRAIRPVARATLKRDTLVQEVADEAGWSVDSGVDGLLELERS